MEPEILLKFEEYLKDSLDLPVKVEKWQGINSLPFFLSGTYDLYEIKIFDRPFILMAPKNNEEFTPAEINRHIEIIREKSGQETILVQPSLASYNRKRLISRRIPFVVPGNQMYLPDLGIDLREHFKKIRSVPEYLSPSAQLLLLLIIIKRISKPITLGEYAGQLRYSKMTMTRAFDELEKAGLVSIYKSGKERFLNLNSKWKELWETALPYLRSPVKAETYLKRADDSFYRHCYKAGLTALSEYTMISAPKLQVFAIGTEEYRYLDNDKTIETIEFPEEAVAKVQEWKYSPKPLTNKNDKTVDKLSLYLSLRNNEDERIQSALEELTRNTEW
jgi:DNA-binding MarR family transcriptional regulator